jgi:hypothetical protein
MGRPFSTLACRNTWLLRFVGGLAGMVASSAQAEVLTPTEADAWLERFSADPQLVWSVPETGCYARAHWMALRLDEGGIETEKIWVEDPRGELWPQGLEEIQVGWRYHVAIIVKVATFDHPLAVRRVLDPAVANRPLAVDEWLSLVSRVRCRPVARRDPYCESGCIYYFSPAQQLLRTHHDFRTEWRSEDEERARAELQRLARQAAVPMSQRSSSRSVGGTDPACRERPLVLPRGPLF